MVVLYFLGLKPRAPVASKAPRGRCDFEKPENNTDLYRQSKKKKKKKTQNSATWSYQKPLEPGFKLKIQLLVEFCSPSGWCKIRWYPWMVGKSVFQTNDTKELKNKAPSVRALVKIDEKKKQRLSDIPWSGLFKMSKISLELYLVWNLKLYASVEDFIVLQNLRQSLNVKYVRVEIYEKKKQRVSDIPKMPKTSLELYLAWTSSRTIFCGGFHSLIRELSQFLNAIC